jgi:hypothetical protein
MPFQLINSPFAATKVGDTNIRLLVVASEVASSVNHLQTRNPLEPFDFGKPPFRGIILPIRNKL